MIIFTTSLILLFNQNKHKLDTDFIQIFMMFGIFEAIMEGSMIIAGLFGEL